MRQGFPIGTDGLRVGLLGGSFDPAHAGHVHISNFALKSFGLDYVWWLVSPGNPLKEHGPAPMDRRLSAARSLVSHPRIIVSNLETHLQTRYTADTLDALQSQYPSVRFVWLMGADNLAGFHRWDRWVDIAQQMPIGVLARPGDQLAAGNSPMARRFAHARLSARRSQALPFRSAPCWCLQTGPMVNLSSTKIRNSGAW